MATFVLGRAICTIRAAFCPQRDTIVRKTAFISARTTVVRALIETSARDCRIEGRRDVPSQRPQPELRSCLLNRLKIRPIVLDLTLDLFAGNENEGLSNASSGWNRAS
jgi:hypothetical protein